MGKKIVTYIICFFIAVCMFALVALGIISTTVFNKQYVLSALEKSEYYNNVYYKIKSDFEELSISAGVDSSELNQIYDLNQVILDVQRVVNRIYDMSEISIDTTSMIEKMDNIINDKLEANNRVPSEEEKEAIKTFETSLANTYINNIEFNSNAISEIVSAFDEFQEMVGKVSMTLLAVFLVLVATVFGVNRRFRRSLRAIASSFVACGIMNVIVSFFVETKVQNVLILSSAFSKSLIYMTNAVLDLFFISGIAFVVIGMVTAIFCIQRKFL